MKRRLAIAVVLAAGAVASYLVWGRDGAVQIRTGSTALSDAVPLRISRTPDAYRVVYRSTLAGTEDVLVSTNKVWVSRPFHSRSESWSGPPPGDEFLTVRMEGFGVSMIRAGDNDPVVLAAAPRPARSDLRFDVMLPEALAAGFVERREVRLVAGRGCQVYRVGDSVDGGQLVPAGTEGQGRYADVCVDEAGLLLEEYEELEGRPFRHRIAVEVEEDPEVPPGMFEVGEPTVPVDEGGGSVRQLEAVSQPPGPFWELREHVEGFEFRGRFAVIPPQPTEFADPTQRSRIVATVADVWVRGREVIVLDRGGSLGGGAPFGDHPHGRAVQVDPLGEAEHVLSFAYNEVRKADGARSVSVGGTVALDALLRVVRDLEPVEGSGSLVYTDEGAPP